MEALSSYKRRSTAEFQKHLKSMLLDLYNRGQKSGGKISFVALLYTTHAHPPPPTSNTTLETSIHSFSRLSTLYWVGRGDCKALSNKGNASKRHPGSNCSKGADSVIQRYRITHRIVQLVSLIRLHWIAIYPMDSAIHLLNNRGLKYKTLATYLFS